MKPTPTRLRVLGHADGQGLELGILTYDARRRQSAFSWSGAALEAGAEWSPLSLPLQARLWQSGQSEHDLLGLPGLIHDALPDGWGLLLMDRSFARLGVPPAQITPLLRLAFLADRCWGALVFEPEWGKDVPKGQRVAVQALAEEAAAVMAGSTDAISQALLLAGGSPQGARPKIAVGLDATGRQAVVGQEELPSGFRHVLIKFAGDGEGPTHPILESCFLDSARRCEIDTMPSMLMEVGGQAAVCVDRFDRQNGQRQHVHSLAGLLHLNHRISNTDWTAVQSVLSRLPGAHTDQEEALRRAVFNAVFCVRDDHTKNLAFRRHADGSWGLSPAFDLTYSRGPGGYHSMLYNGHRGQHVTWPDLTGLAARFGVSEPILFQWVTQARAERMAMLAEARGLGVDRALLAELRVQFRAIDADLRLPQLRARPPKIRV